MSTITIKDFEGKPVTLKVGDYVGFKYDIEQSGPITAINGDRVTVTATQGGYVHRDDCHEDCEGCRTSVDLRPSDLWVD